ncbi:MAG: hypothetical protein ACE5GB_12500 [Acidimicrobiales bacterium]
MTLEQPVPSHDPRDVVVRAAASVIVLAERPELEVLLLRRREASIYVGGMVVFPGGAVDPGDADAVALVDGETVVPDLDERQARAHVVAGVRETLEEAGIWLGAHPDAPVAARRGIDEGRVKLADVAVAGSVDPAALPHAGRWVTPLGSPRRYDPQVFVAQAADDTIEADGTEVVHAEWSRPERALERIEAGRLRVIYPTFTYLSALAGYRRIADVLATARRGRRRPRGAGGRTICGRCCSARRGDGSAAATGDSEQDTPASIDPGFGSARRCDRRRGIPLHEFQRRGTNRDH